MKVLLIGGNGFIGSHISDWLLRNNHQVRVLDKYPEKYRAPSVHIDYRIAEIESLPAVLEAMEGIDLVFHLLSTTVPSTSNADMINDINQNLNSSINILNLMVKANVKKIVYFSTGGAIYGHPEKVPIPETHPNNPISSYGIVKLAVEKYLYMYERNYDISPLIIRPSNPYGPRQGHVAVQGVIPTYLLNLFNNEAITVWGDGTIVRDYLYIDDLVKSSCLLALGQSTGIYNIGSGVGYSLNEIIDIIGRVTGRKVQVKYLPSRKVDIDEVVLDTTKLGMAVHQEPMIPIEEGVSRLWEWINLHAFAIAAR